MTVGTVPSGPAAPARTRAGSWPVVAAWALFALVLLVFVGYPWLDRLARDAGRADLALLAPFAIPPSLAALAANTVGAVLASRRPRHPVGWLLLAIGLTMAVAGAAAGYVPYGLVVRPGALPAADLLARVDPPLVAATLALLGFVLLLTPTGSPPSPRWRWWAWVSAGTMAVLLAAGLTGAAMLATGVLIAVGMVDLAAWSSVLGTVFLPLATGAAILRYRLYDLDRIVSRTVAYALLTVVLGLGYAAVVLGLGRLLPLGSSLAVAAATLAVAAVFRPARRRVQAAVDRRFNRRRYDATRTIEAFGSRLRDQVDLDGLTAELLAVVDQTMQPTRATLWLRPAAGPAPAGRPTGR